MAMTLPKDIEQRAQLANRYDIFDRQYQAKYGRSPAPYEIVEWALTELVPKVREEAVQHIREHHITSNCCNAKIKSTDADRLADCLDRALKTKARGCHDQD